MEETKPDIIYRGEEHTSPLLLMMMLLLDLFGFYKEKLDFYTDEKMNKKTKKDRREYGRELIYVVVTMTYLLNRYGDVALHLCTTTGMG